MTKTTVTRKARRAALNAFEIPTPVTDASIKPTKKRLVKPRSTYSLPGKYSLSADRIGAALAQLSYGYLDMWADVCEQACTDPILSRGYFIRRAAIAGRKFTVSAPEDVDPAFKDEAEQLALVVRNWLSGLEGLEDFLMRVLDAIGFGVNAHELNWVEQGDLILPIPTAIASRELIYDGDSVLFARSDLNAEYINTSASAYPGKFLIHQPSINAGKPHTQGAFRAAIGACLHKRAAVVEWVSAVEKFNRPIPVAMMAEGTMPEAAAAALLDLQNVNSETAAVVIGGSRIDIIESKMGTSAAVYLDLITSMNNEILQAIGVTPDLIFAGPNGSRSATEVRDGIRLESSKLDAVQLWASIRRDVVKYIAFYNRFSPDCPLPVIESVFDDVLTIPDSVIKSKCATNNEVRAMAGLKKWTKEQGGEDIAVFDAPVVVPQPIPPAITPPPKVIPPISGSL